MRKPSKGEATRSQILQAGLQAASEGGFDALTIGSLAERTGLSKSGLFAHFGSKDELQIAVLDEAARRFTEIAFMQAMRAPRGLPRLRALFENWISWSDQSKLLGGCPIMAAAFEFDDRPGPVRDAVADHHGRLRREMERCVELAVEAGHFRPDTDSAQFAFEMLGLATAYYVARRLLKDRNALRHANGCFERMVAHWSIPAASVTSLQPAARKIAPRKPARKAA